MRRMSATQLALLQGPRLDLELWLIKRLGDHGAVVFHDDAALRKERIRAAILANGLSSVLIGQHGGKPETYAGCFRRLYGEAL